MNREMPDEVRKAVCQNKAIDRQKRRRQLPGLTLSLHQLMPRWLLENPTRQRPNDGPHRSTCNHIRMNPQLAHRIRKSHLKDSPKHSTTEQEHHRRALLLLHLRSFHLLKSRPTAGQLHMLSQLAFRFPVNFRLPCTSHATPTHLGDPRPRVRISSSRRIPSRKRFQISPRRHQFPAGDILRPITPEDGLSRRPQLTNRFPQSSLVRRIAMRPLVRLFLIGFQHQLPLFNRPCVRKGIRYKPFNHRPTAVCHRGVNQFSTLHDGSRLGHSKRQLMISIRRHQPNLGGNKSLRVLPPFRNRHHFST